MCALPISISAQVSIAGVDLEFLTTALLALMVNLGESFTITELARVPDLALLARIVVPESLLHDGNSSRDSIVVGVSKLMIADYVLRPTPKLVWSYPLPPNTIVDAMDAKDLRYIVGLSERRKSKLILINRTASENVAAKSVALKSSARSIHIIDDLVYVLTSDGNLKIFSILNEGEFVAAKEAPALPVIASKNTKVEHHVFLPQSELKHDYPLLLAIMSVGDTLTFRLMALDGKNTSEVYLIPTEIASYSLTFAYSAQTVYVLNKESLKVESRALMKPQEITKSVSISNLLGEVSLESIIALVAAAPDRLLVSHKSLVFLINFKFESVLGEHTNNTGNSVFVQFALPVLGTSVDSCSTFALYLNLEEKTKVCKLKLMHIDVGLNLLKESLGTAIDKPADLQISGLPSITSSKLNSANASGKKEFEECLQRLEEDLQKKDAEKFDRHFVKFYKGGNRGNLHFVFPKDRDLDDAFIRGVLNLIFTIEERRVKVRDESFIPEKALTCLLLHPMFPREYASGLLFLLSELNRPKLLTPAIQSCAVLSQEELLLELLNLTELYEELNAEEALEAEFVLSLVNMTITRLVQEFSTERITACLGEILNTELEPSSRKLDRILGVLISINSNSSWALVQCVIDVGGLFNWSLATITRINDIITQKIEALKANSHNLTLVLQSVLSHQKRAKKYRETTRVVDNIHEVSNHRDQLSAILTMDALASNSALASSEDHSIKLALQIPPYSRERLVL